MRQYYYFPALILLFLLASKITLSNSIQNDGRKVYLIVSFQNPEMFRDSSSQHKIKSEIENIFENKGIHIIHEEKPEEYKSNINILIGDSLIIEENSIGVGGGDSIVEVKHPKVIHSYKNESEIYNSIKSYIKNNF
jgi:hypothetical protein